MKFQSLPDDTNRIFHLIANSEVPGSSFLCGGTGLSLIINHRKSEDLDFLVANETLSTQAIESWVDSMLRQGVMPVDCLSIAAIHDSLNEGIDLKDYQQDFLVDGVKVSWIALPDNLSVLKAREKSGDTAYKNIIVPSVDTLFKLKVVALHERIKSRDVFDIACLIKLKGYSIEDVLESLNTITSAHNHSIEQALSNLQATTFPLNDEPVEHLISDESPFASMDEAVSFLAGECADWRTRQDSATPSMS